MIRLCPPGARKRERETPRRALRMRRSIAAVALSASLACAPAAQLKPAPAEPARKPVLLTYLGVAGWSLSDGATTLLVDPFFSRGIPLHQGPLHPDEAQIAARSPAQAALILVTHAHADHLLDVPLIAARTGAQIVGTQSTFNYARASGIALDHLITVQGGEDFLFEGFSLRVLPGLHSALEHKHALDAARTIAADVTPPLAFDQFAEGGTLDYLVRIAGHQILFIGSANFIERELEGLRPDIAVVATGLREELYDYTRRLMRALGEPPLVLANHFDSWTEPLEKDLRPDPDTQQDLDAFAAEVHRFSPRTNVIIPEHGKTIAVP